MFRERAGTAILALSILTGGCTTANISPINNQSESSSPVATENAKPDLTYNGQLTDHLGISMEGKPLISDDLFNKLTDALQNTNSSLLIKTAKDITLLHNSQNNPTGISKFTDEATTPFPIIVTQSDASAILTYAQAETSLSFKLIANNVNSESPFVANSQYGIELAIPNSVANDTNLVKSMFLAKETLSFEVFQNILNNPRATFGSGFEFLSLDGKSELIGDQLDRALYSITYVTEGQNPKLKMIIDGLPVLMMAPSIMDLVQKGQLPATSKTLGKFYDAANFLIENPDYLDKINKLNNKWLTSDKISGPDGMSADFVSLDILNIVNEFYPLMSNH